jgi:hypothetical protein
MARLAGASGSSDGWAGDSALAKRSGTARTSELVEFTGGEDEEESFADRLSGLAFGTVKFASGEGAELLHVSHFCQLAEDVQEHFCRGLAGVDLAEEFGAVEVEDGLAFAFIDLEAVPDDFEVGVIEPVLFEGTPLETGHQLLHIGWSEVEDCFNFESVFEHFGLMNIPGDTVKNERVFVGVEATSFGHAFDEVAPKRDGWFVRNEVSATGVFEKDFADRRVCFEAAEDVTAGAMEEVGNGAEDFSLGALAGARGSEEENGTVIHFVTSEVIWTKVNTAGGKSSGIDEPMGNKPGRVFMYPCVGGEFPEFRRRG